MNAIDLEVIYQSTLQIAGELTLNMLRTGYSTIIKESQDFTFAVFDAAGRMVAQGIPQPLHIGPLAAQVNEIRRRFGQAIEPGDAFIVNHPYQACQNHATDITVISPMFAGERLLGLSAISPTSRISAARCPAPTAAMPRICFRKGY